MVSASRPPPHLVAASPCLSVSPLPRWDKYVHPAKRGRPPLTGLSVPTWALLSCHGPRVSCSPPRAGLNVRSVSTGSPSPSIRGPFRRPVRRKDRPSCCHWPTRQ
jgi:hypothetical protein